MSHLILCPKKVFVSTPSQQWRSLIKTKTVLITGAGAPSENLTLERSVEGIFERIVFVKNFADNDVVELVAEQLNQSYRFTQILALAEADLLRAARLRERWGISGSHPTEIEPFRNKILMKSIARAAGVPVADFQAVRNALEVYDFARKHSFPIILKPIAGRGSVNTWKIKSENELCTIMETGPFANAHTETEMLCESFVEGEIYHVDGLMLNREVKIMSASKYVNNCLNFVQGNYLGSYTLADTSELSIRLRDFSKNLLNNVYSPPSNTIFHIEIFVQPDGNLVLCEIACRLGGNGINNEILHSQGADIKTAYVNAELNGESEIPNYIQRNLVGRLLIPPKKGTLRSVPKTCPRPDVLEYQTRGKPGLSYAPMKMSNDEIAYFLFTGLNEDRMEETIKDLATWFEASTTWSEM